MRDFFESATSMSSPLFCWERRLSASRALTVSALFVSIRTRPSSAHKSLCLWPITHPDVRHVKIRDKQERGRRRKSMAGKSL